MTIIIPIGVAILNGYSKWSNAISVNGWLSDEAAAYLAA
jgi:hypothetical protein